MRVKRLEIQGFKSFKDKTVIHFDHSITGIVGPNGCGKSNIVDAFFWVMGEQSYKHMRGSSSDDLIFNGSSKYSPLGMAEATLVLETNVVDTQNAPAGATFQDIPLHLKTKEISVTRRLFREGEGEYFINGIPARLKDIHELFMDTGVGAKGYSVIEQGQIGKVINAKPEERRLLIEEAAGIAKYKARKKESLRKMEATHANLARLMHIIQEIEKNLASLDRQAQKARQYKKYKEELLQKEVTWGKKKRAIFQSQIETSKGRREILEQDLVLLKTALQTSENTVETDRIQLVSETKNAEALQQEIQDLSQELSTEKSALELSKRRQGDLEIQLESLSKEKLELQTQIESDQIRCQEKENELHTSHLNFEQIQTQASQRSAQVKQVQENAQGAHHEQAEAQKQLKSQMTQLSELKSQSAALLGRQEAEDLQLERLNHQRMAQEEKLQKLKEELLQLQEVFQGLVFHKEELLLEKKNQDEKLQEEEKKLKKFEKDLEQSLRSFTQLQSKLQSLDELDQAHEGLSEGSRSALHWSKVNQKSIRALTDHLQVKPGYETAVQSYLENQIENLISENSEAAAQVITHLQKNKQGRVRILIPRVEAVLKPAEVFQKFEKVKNYLESQKLEVLGELKDFVQCSQSISSVQKGFEYLCLVKSFGDASELLESIVKNLDLEILRGWSIISLDGIVLDSQGVLRGGSQELSGGIAVLKRKQSLEELRIQVQAAQDQHETLAKTLEDFRKGMVLARARYQTLQLELQSLEVQAARSQQNVLQTERACREAESIFRSLESEVLEGRLEIEKALKIREEIEVQSQELSAEKLENEEKLLILEQALEKQEEQLKQEETELQVFRIQEAELKGRLLSLKKELEGLKSLLQDRTKRFEEVKRILEKASEEKNQFSGGESFLEEKIQELTFTLSDSRQKLALIKDHIEQSNASMNFHMEKMKESHKEVEQKSDEVKQLSIELEKISGEISHLTLNLEEKYGQDCLDQKLAPPEGFQEVLENETILGEEVERLRERIYRLGEVNLMAIEEYEQLNKRCEHLLTEKADLEKSLQNLQAAIEHINKTSVDRFKKAFDAIANRFEKLFPIIFGGGQAKLSLLYPEGSTDILEAGVDILAQPPGKKIANITLLSGGEKALTAVSLIFAVFMVKPSPFCVLDEVDAPLDDANIGKFNALLKEMASKSQFILITHNKKTMELNDTLYGVTMEEPGVSKMVSIEMH